MAFGYINEEKRQLRLVSNDSTDEMILACVSRRPDGKYRWFSNLWNSQGRTWHDDWYECLQSAARVRGIHL